jgi:type IV fimbrial biogenesis protein FimT
MQQRRQIGFTLIELMVTIIVAAVLVSLAVPGFRDLIEKSRLRGATDDIVNLLNASRASAVKLGLDVNASVKIASATSWCAGAVSATDPLSNTSTIGQAANSAAACDCTSSTACTISGLGKLAGQKLVVSSDSYSGVKLSSDNANVILNGNGGLIFNSKLGALEFSALANIDALTVTSSSGKYKTQITVSPLGQTNVCTSSGFVSGYSSC